MELRSRATTVLVLAAVVCGPTASASAAERVPADGADRSAVAQPAGERRGAVSLAGTVVAVEAGSLVLRSRERGVLVSRRLAVGSTTRVQRNGTIVRLADVRPGDRALAQGSRVGSGVVLSRLRAVGLLPQRPSSPTASPAPRVGV